MIFLGDYIAIGLVIVLSLFYFERRTNWRYMSTDNRYFVACLFLTALTALTDLLTGWLLTVPTAPLWLELAANTAYFLVNIITTSFFALFLFTKILEHAIDSHCMTYARRGLAILFSLYLILVCSNFWTGILFYFDEQGNYCRGPFNAAGYIVTLLQMCLVMMCYLRNKKNANKPMRRVLAQTFPVIVLCIIIQRFFPEVMLNTFFMAMVALVLFLSFQGQRQGVHSLTELNDRHRFFKEIEQRIMHKSPFRVFLINIKNFGTINQKYGHLFGDELLYQFAFALERLFKESISFHMNGTVFALVLPAAVQTLAEEQCGTLLGFLEEKVACRNKQVSLDYILVEYTADGTEGSAAEFYEKLEYAATKAYQDKHKYTRYEPEMGAKMERDRYLLDRLQTVDRAAGYEVWYQPVQCLATGRFCSMEALIRLREQDGSLVSPAEFIPLAEETGRISSVTWFVLEEVCHLLATTPELRDISVSVNMPMPQLLDKGFVPRLNSIVDRAGIPHRNICLEFTERAILDNFESTKDIMEQLTKDGYRFFLDDFGTGYSNFNCLLQLPFQIIKLDACLVKQNKNNSRNYDMVRTLTKMFHDMDLEIIAEGAETAAEVNDLAEKGVDRVQGFALARPMPVDALLEFYRKQPSAQ